MPNKDGTKRASPTQQRLYVPDLKKKLESIPPFFGEANNITKLSMITRIPRATLQEQINNDGVTTSIVQKIEAGLRDWKFTFSASWVEWRDPSKAGRDNHEAFENKLKSENQGFDPQLWLSSKGRRRTDIPLIVGARRKPKRLAEVEGLASVEIDGLQPGAGTVSIDLVVSVGRPVFAEIGRQFSLPRSRLELDCGEALITRSCRKGWLDGSMKALTADDTSVNYEAGDRSAPAWRIVSRGPSVGSVEFDPDHVALEGLAPNDIVTARLGAWFKDANVEPTDGATNDHPSSEAVSIMGPDGKEIEDNPVQVSALRERVIARICKELLPADSNGYYVLCEHELQLVEKSDNG